MFLKKIFSEEEPNTDNPGQGGEKEVGKPEWMPDQFWNSDRAKQVGEATPARIETASEVMAQSYSELQKKLSGKQEQYIEEYQNSLKASVPENYELSISKEIVPEGVELKLSDEDPVVAWYKETAKNRNLSQDDFNADVNKFVEIMAKSVQAEQQAALEALGDKAQERIASVENWLSANAPENVMTAAATLSDDLNLVTLMEWVMEQSAEKGSHQGQYDSLTEDDLTRMMADVRYRDSSHPEYNSFQTKVQKGWEKLKGTAPFNNGQSQN